MAEYREDQLLALSGIQHFYFCRRQWALIHIERQWKENESTVAGKLVHKKTDDPFFKETRPGLIISRALPVVSYKLGLFGICDVVEFHESDDGIRLYGQDKHYLPIPIEYKLGKPKIDKRDEVQLCAQAMCLEHMLSINISKACFFYAKIRRRHEISLSHALRDLVKKLSMEMHDYYDRGYTPRVKPNKGCNRCSLKEICLPSMINDHISVREYIQVHITQD